MLASDVTVGMSLTGALTPAGLGGSCIVPLIQNGFVDWIVSTGANLYHDTHFAIGQTLHRGSPFIDDRILRKAGVIRIYDILFDYEVLLKTDEFFRTLVRKEEFQREMGTAELHYLLGWYIAEVALSGHRTRIDVLLDVNETAAIVLDAKRHGGESGVLILGGGSPKNFLLQTEPQIQEILGIDEPGHDYFLQCTDGRPDAGGLSGATPTEAVSWGKVDPDQLPSAVVAYVDSTIALPLLTAYALKRRSRRKLKRLYARREEMMRSLKREYDLAREKTPSL